MKNKTWSIVCEIGKGSDADGKKLQQYLQQEKDARQFIGSLAKNRMCGLAYEVLKENHLLIFLNREIRSVLEAVHYYNCVRNQSFAVCKEQTAKLLYKAGISYAALKGAYLTEIYPSGSRISNDLDILIRREDLAILSAYFLQNGFVQGLIRNEEIAPASRRDIVNALLNRGEVIPFVKAVDLPALRFLEIDINLSLKGEVKPEEQEVEAILKNRIKINPQKRHSLYMPDAVDFLIQLCVHLYKEATKERWIQRGMDWTLYKFSDIYLFCQKNVSKQFADEFSRRVKLYQLQKECAYSLYYTDRQLKFSDNDLLCKMMGEGGMQNEFMFEET